MSVGGGAKSVSVIVPAYRAEACLQACVDSILGQELAHPLELIVVVSGTVDDDLAYAQDISADPRLTVLCHTPHLSAAQARNLGVEKASAELLVFTDADVVAEQGWLAALVSSATGESCVAGAIVNGTPHSRAGTTEYLVEFLDFHPRRPRGSVWHGATCNLALTRDAWARYGPFTDVRALATEPGVPGSADTVLTLEAASDRRLVFCPGATVRHMNRTKLFDVLAHQWALGRNAADLARKSTHYPLRHLLERPWMAPVVVLARWMSLWRRLLFWRVGLAWRGALLMGYIALALGAWGLGLFHESRRIRRADGWNR